MQLLLQLALVVGNATTANSASKCTGNSATATKLATARNIKMQGAISGNVDFDGSKAVTINTTQSNIAVVTGTITVYSSDPKQGSGNINYPTGYTRDNCIPLSIGMQVNGAYRFGGNMMGTTYVELNASVISVLVDSWNSSGMAAGNYPVKVILMKVS